MPSEIQSVIKLVLVMSHCQASVEGGCNVKKSVNKVNISRDSIVARKLIIDHMQKKDLNGALSGLRQFLATESPLIMMKMLNFQIYDAPT